MAPWRRLLRPMARLCRQDDGTASVMPLFMLTGLLVAGGFCIDTANLWRNGEVMRATADAAAHAGAVALARGSAPDDALALAEEAIALNMDAAVFAPAPGKPRSDLVRLWHYDATTGTLSEEGEPNAVSVQIRRSVLDGNELPMYLLDLFGLPAWTTATTSVVALTPSSRCNNSAGIYARAALEVQGEVELGEGFCLHSQQAIALERPAKLEDGALLSLPDMARCTGWCGDAFDTRSTLPAQEVNLISRPLGEQIGDLITGMLGPVADSPAKTAFFADRPLDDDLEPLAELGIDYSDLRTGSVLRLSRDDFEMLREVPAGLVYAVFCDQGSLEPPVLQIRGGMNGPPLRDSVVLTNCALHFADDIEVTGALVISTHVGDLPSITADPYALLGDPSVTCDPSALAQVMVLGDQVLPANLLLSNVALAVDGNVTLQAEQGGMAAQHMGFALHASGQVQVQGQHRFKACEDQGNLATLPALNLIRFAMPRIPAQPAQPQFQTDMPGKKAKPLPSTPSLPMSRQPPSPGEQLMSQIEGPPSRIGL